MALSGHRKYHKRLFLWTAMAKPNWIVLQLEDLVCSNWLRIELEVRVCTG